MLGFESAQCGQQQKAAEFELHKPCATLAAVNNRDERQESRGVTKKVAREAGGILWPMATAFEPWEREWRESMPAPLGAASEYVVAHTYTNILIHALFGTKDRYPWLIPELQGEVFEYLGGTVNKLGGQSLLVNGASDHVHMLFVQPAALALADLMEKVKANSSGWIKRRWTRCRGFAWQTGYTAFSVSKSQVDRVREYIAGQEEHHRKVTFQEEVLAFLKKQGIAYDPKYLFNGRPDIAPMGLT